MTYEQTLNHLYTQLPMFSRIGAAAYNKDLHNTLQLSASLGDSHRQFKSIHIAGTNGKGSTSAMLAAILQKAGYKTGLYTSPHLKDFRERIMVDGELIGKDFIVDFVEKTKALTAELKPSFFELTVVMAYEYFAKEKVDFAVIETGLGGRLDSTNIISPILSVITNIGYDHMHLLGNTLPEIASEKAGIIKKDTPVVIGEVFPETLPVFLNKANQEGAILHLATEEFMVEYIDLKSDLLLCNVRNVKTDVVEKLRLGVCGLYQTKNVCTVLSCIEVLRTIGVKISEADIHQSLENISIPGRWQILETNPMVILDVAHNEDGIKYILEQLKQSYRNATYHFVLGFVNDKEITKILSLFPADAKYYFTNAHIPRALPMTELQKIAEEYLLMGDCFDDVNQAINNAKKAAMPNDVVIVCGSFFIIAEVGEDQGKSIDLKNSKP